MTTYHKITISFINVLYFIILLTLNDNNNNIELCGKSKRKAKRRFINLIANINNYVEIFIFKKDYFQVLFKINENYKKMITVG